MFQNVEAVIFDMDGTLLDSMHVWRQIDIEFMGERNLVPPDGFGEAIEGMRFFEVAQYYKKIFGMEETLEEIQGIWHEMAVQKYRDEIILKNGALDFLKGLKTKTIKMGIATSNSRELSGICLKSLGIFEMFDTIVTGDDVKVGKPAPDIYLKAAGNLNVKPDSCLIFEDIPAGIQAGKNAGMKTCAIYDQCSVDLTEKKKEMADFYIHSFEEIVPLLI